MSNEINNINNFMNKRNIFTHKLFHAHKQARLNWFIKTNLD